MVSKPRTAILFLMGPTAAGKTAAAVELVQRHPFEIVSADSALVYRGMEIGTARPDADTLARAPHHLINMVEPSESYSAGRFRSDALDAIARIRSQGKIPLVVGGTLLYLRALSRGLAAMPTANPEVRAQIDDQAQKRGWLALHRDLAAVDPEAAARISPNDCQRIQRALEVYRQTGETITALQQRHIPGQPCADVIYRVSWSPDRETLYSNCEIRLNSMIENGFIDEVDTLFRRPDLDSRTPALRAVGYRQLGQYVTGNCDLATATRQALIATRRLAKRQLSWLRGERGVVWLDPRHLRSAKQLNQLAARVVRACRD